MAIESTKRSKAFHRRAAAVLLAVAVVAGTACAQPVHLSVAAGVFFPGTRDSLARMVEVCSRISKNPPPFHTAPIGVLAPHAAFQYSGPVEASAYRAVEQGRYKTVVILGPSHTLAFTGVAITPAGSWETPLGRVAIDTARSRDIMRRCPFVRDSLALFKREYSIEVQLPFIQRTLPQCAIVPLDVGSLTGDQYSALSDVLADMIEDAPGDVLIVASSDLSHYHTDRSARQVDSVTLANILTGDPSRVVADLNRGLSEMCGYAPVLTLMLVANKVGARPTRIGYATTANATGDTARVVGYGAVSFTVPDAPVLSEQDKSALLALARRSVVAATRHTTTRDTVPPTPVLATYGSLFVTLTKHGTLRGCVGQTYATLPLWKAALEMGAGAACHDARFPPLTKAEAKSITVEVSVLSPVRRVHSVNEITVGTHGLYIAKGDTAGALLPQVAVENHWSRDEFLKNVCLKAGLPPDAWHDPEVKLYVFTAEVISER